MAEKPKYYWDACAWIALIQREVGRFEDLNFIMEETNAGNVELWTSNFTLAEVFKRPCDAQQKGLTVVDDTEFERFILQDIVIRAQVDFDVGTLARRLLRAHPTIAKPQDAIHLATALLNNIDQLHTYDRSNLTALSGKIKRKDGKTLRICSPPKRPPIPAPPPAPVLPSDLFSTLVPSKPAQTEAATVQNPPPPSEEEVKASPPSATVVGSASPSLPPAPAPPESKSDGLTSKAEPPSQEVPQQDQQPAAGKPP